MVNERAQEAFYQRQAAQRRAKPWCRRMSSRDEWEDQRVLHRNLANMMSKGLKVPLPCLTELLIQIVFQPSQQLSHHRLEQVFTP